MYGAVDDTGLLKHGQCSFSVRYASERKIDYTGKMLFYSLICHHPLAFLENFEKLKKIQIPYYIFFNFIYAL